MAFLHTVWVEFLVCFLAELATQRVTDRAVGSGRGAPRTSCLSWRGASAASASSCEINMKWIGIFCPHCLVLTLLGYYLQKLPYSALTAQVVFKIFVRNNSTLYMETTLQRVQYASYFQAFSNFKGGEEKCRKEGTEL